MHKPLLQLMNTNCKVVFLPSQTTLQKITSVTVLCKRIFLQKEPLLLLTESEKASQFLDILLWEHPKESFLPHGIFPSSELLCISSSLEQAQEYKNVFNLTSNPLTPLEKNQVLYELDDLSSLEKQALSKKKFSFYRSLGFSISSE